MSTLKGRLWWGVGNRVVQRGETRGGFLTYKVFIKCCVFFPQEFSKLCSLYLAGTGLLLLVQKMTSQKEGCTCTLLHVGLLHAEDELQGIGKNITFNEHSVLLVPHLKILSTTPDFDVTQPC